MFTSLPCTYWVRNKQGPSLPFHPQGPWYLGNCFCPSHIQSGPTIQVTDTFVHRIIIKFSKAAFHFHELCNWLVGQVAWTMDPKVHYLFSLAKKCMLLCRNHPPPNLFTGLDCVICGFLEQDTSARWSHNWGPMTCPACPHSRLYLVSFTSIPPTTSPALSPRHLIQCFLLIIIDKYILNKCLVVGIIVTKVEGRLTIER